jgi:VanZ family protein
MVKEIYRWGPAVVCAAFIFAFSHQSNLTGQEWIAGYDYVMHFLEYAFFGLTLVWGTTSGLRSALTLKGAAAVCAVALLYALSDEWHQSLVPSREASWLDVAADAVGSIASVMIVFGAGQGKCRHAPR